MAIGPTTDKTPMSCLDKTPMTHQVDPLKKTSKYLGEGPIREAPAKPPLPKRGAISGGLSEWEKFSTTCRENIRHDSVLKLADEWAVSVESLYALEIGFDDQCQAYTFPMRNAQGQIVGVRRRFYKDSHSKRCVKGSSLGIFVPDGVTRANFQTIVEGESDTAAALTLGFAAIGRPGAMHCHREVVHFASHKLNACPCIVADNDESGCDGASLLAAALLEAGVPCQLLIVPEPHSDLRNWLKAGLNTEGLIKVIQAKEIDYPPGHPQGFAQTPNALIRRGLIAEVGTTAFSVLLCLDSFANGDGSCWPSREIVANLTRLSIRQVDRAKMILAKAGLLVWQRGGTGRANEYRVDLGPCRWVRNPHKIIPALLGAKRPLSRSENK